MPKLSTEQQSIPCPREWEGCKFASKDLREVAHHIFTVHKPNNVSAFQVEQSLKSATERAAKPMRRR